MEKRAYDNTLRSKNAGKTSLKIMQATGELWKELSVHDLTLEKIAEQAGVTVRTILRKFGSKEALFQECLAYDAANIEKDRALAPVGDLDAILHSLLSNYEEIGDASIRTVYLEQELDIARKIGDRGRALHRQWCARVFAPYLPPQETGDYEVKLAAFIAATEVYLWKLLRRDMELDPQKTFQVFHILLQGLISKTYNADQNESKA